MAKYTDLIIPRLKDLKLEKYAIETIPREIKNIDLRMSMIRSSRTDGDPIKGGTNRREDILIGYIAEKAYLEKKLLACKEEVYIIESAMSKLPQNERICIERFFVNGDRNAWIKLSEELGYEKSQIYRIRNSGLINLARMLYGSVEL